MKNIKLLLLSLTKCYSFKQTKNIQTIWKEREKKSKEMDGKNNETKILVWERSKKICDVHHRFIDFDWEKKQIRFLFHRMADIDVV